MRLLRPLTGAAAIVLLAGLVGCEPLAERQLEFSDTERVKITEIRVAPGSGDLVVRTGPVADVEVRRVIRYRSGNPEQHTYRIEGSTLFIDIECGRACSVSYDILAPAGVAVRGENGSGDVSLTDVAVVDFTVGSGDVAVSGATGAVRAETGSGDITLARLPGAVAARATSGDIEGRELGAGKVQAETGSGNITLTLSTAASVEARASSGSVTLSVPAGGYQVRTATGSGNAHSEVPNAPDATAVLDASTGSGDITIQQR
ncbi:DUF4097 family beta strand repeat-containing protein [Plantactinospora sonchi]|uniref:DUF4097 family beta strand repeat-containing protein n=1 Tax=Plantactinospora sonchi TaxID=1544735 RepID=A0ABU7S5I7_9ACTN